LRSTGDGHRTTSAPAAVSAEVNGPVSGNATTTRHPRLASCSAVLSMTRSDP
jgi:hypothetical protein